MAEPDKSSARILIAGGGPTGLLAAQALKKQGYNCKVFEQDPYYGSRPRDWNFGIYWAQDPLRECLSDDMIDRVVKEAQVDFRGMSPESVLPFYNSQTGDLMKNIPIPNQIRIHRLNFVKLIAQGLDVQYKKRVQRIEESEKTVTLFFEDGTQEEGEFLIGAEGAHSKVREFLLGRDEGSLQQTQLVASCTMAKQPKEAALLSLEKHPRMYSHTHPDGEWWFSCVHDAWEGTEPGDWTFMYLLSRLVDDSYDPSALKGPAILADIKERAKKTAEPFRTILLSIPDDSLAWHNRLSYWIPRPWDNRGGRITLLGDAAHPMTFHRGQGFNNGVLDASCLAREVAEKGLAKGIAAYEQETQKRGKETVIANLENSLMIHDIAGLSKSHLFVHGAVQNMKKVEVGAVVPEATNGI